MKKTLRSRLSLNYAAWAICLTACLAVGVGAQQYSDYLSIPVTFYDFHSDRSNPEFEQPHMGGHRREMVGRYLDADGKPVATASATPWNQRCGADDIPKMNQGVRFWFRDWSNLSSYKMANVTNSNARDTSGAAIHGDPRYGNRGYLERFRPIYMYRKQSEPNNANYIQPPPALRQFTNHNNNQADIWATSSCSDNDNAFWWREGNAPFVWTANAYGTDTTIGGNTYSVSNAYQNRKIPANLHFAHQGGGVYEFRVGYITEDDGYTPRCGFFPFVDARDSDNPNMVTYRRGSGGTAQNRCTNSPNNPISGRVEFTGNSPNERPFFENITTQSPQNWVSSDNLNRGWNWSYSMELEHEFRYQRDLTFHFEGDDDVWLFINGQLVDAIDIGGIHNPVQGSINLNFLERSHGLVAGQKAMLNFFYSERHSDGSSIRINTNILTPILDSIGIDVKGDNALAGVPIPAKGTIIDADGEVWTNYSQGTFTWNRYYVTGDGGTRLPGQGTTQQNWTPPAGYPTINLTNPTGGTNLNTDSIHIMTTRAHVWVRVIGTYYDAGLGMTVTDSADVYIRPGQPTALFVENNSWSTGALPPPGSSALWYPDTVGTILISPTATTEQGFYAVLRDQWNNWYGPAFVFGADGNPASGRTLNWVPTVAGVATLANVTRSTTGEGVATRVGDSGETPVNVTYTIQGQTPITGTTRLLIQEAEYRDVAIGTVSGGEFMPLVRASLPSTSAYEMAVGETQTFHVYVLRAYDNTWVPAPSPSWTVTNIPGVNANQAVGSQIPVTPDNSTNNGRLTASNSGMEVTLPIIVTQLPAGTVRFFTSRTGGDLVYNPTVSMWIQPAALPQRTMYAPTVTVTAGSNVPLLANLFTSPPPAGTWLSDLVGAPGTASRWRWSFLPATFDGANDIVRGNVSLNGTTGQNATASGDSVIFRATAAHHTYQLQAVYSPENGTPVSYVINIRVVPDTRTPVLYIEASSRGSMNEPERLGEMVFTPDDSPSRSAFAILRDQFGNYIAPSGATYDPVLDPTWPTSPLPTVWTPAQSANQAAYAEARNPTLGEGLITKVDDGGNVWVYATDNNFTVGGARPKDSVMVRILGYSYDEIMMVQECPSAGGDVVIPGYCKIPDNVLRMTTNDRKEVFVLGRCNTGVCSNGQEWELVGAEWSRNANLVGVVNVPPAGSGRDNWTFVPEGTGSGAVTVSRPGPGGALLTHEVQVVVTAGPPHRAEIRIITPEAERIAGRPIQMEVLYFNSAGQIPMDQWNAEWTNPDGAHFAGTLGTIGDWIPGINTVAKGGDILFYNGITDPKRNNAIMSIVDGRMIFTVTLYLAANNHRVTYEELLNFGGGTLITGETPLFTVLAGAPRDLEIVPEGGGYVSGDTLYIRYTDPDAILRARVKDEYGNELAGDYPSDWSTPIADTGVPTVDVANRPLVQYRPSTALDNGNAVVCAEIPGQVNVNGEPLRDCITIDLRGVTTLARMVITRDRSGCGYLDAIDLKFPKAIDLTDALKANDGKLPDPNMIRVIRGTVSIPVERVTVNLADSSAILHLTETRDTPLQTGWTPTVTIEDGVFVDADYQVHTATDGAPPVISRARLFFPSSGTGNVRENYIEVTFAENVRSPNRNSFRDDAPNYKPIDLFNIWTISTGQNRRTTWMSRRQAARLARTAHNSDESNVYNLEVNYLDGINQLHFVNDSTLRFYLENEKELGPPRHHINIRTDAPAEPHVHIWDMPQNRPLDNNRKVPITYGNQPNEQARPIPNPAQPDQTRVPGGQISARHDEGAVDFIKGGGGGTVFEVPIYVPESPGSRVRSQLKVYDLAGNLVIAGESDRVREDFLDNQGEFVKLHLYWNGFNSKSMRVAPGTYRMVVHISYTGNLTTAADRANAKNRRFQGLVGMSK